MTTSESFTAKNVVISPNFPAMEILWKGTVSA